MNSLAFFPWWQLKDKICTSTFELIPYDNNLDIDVVSKIGKIAECYKIAPKSSIRNFAILKFNNKKILDPLSEDEIRKAFQISYILAFCGLSCRIFFRWPFDYYNSDSFRLVIQGFKDDLTGITEVKRRRDGTCTNLCLLKHYVVHIPSNIYTNCKIQIDLDLFNAIHSLMDKPNEGEEIYESIIGFNNSNTDNVYIRPERELVYLCGAFEKALKCKSNKDDFANKLELSIDLSKKVDINSSHRFKKLDSTQKSKVSEKSLLYLWATDFYITRNQLAHGSFNAKERLWTINEHLILGSFIFPIMIKTILANKKIYTMNDSDIISLNAFEKLADHDIFGKTGHHPEDFEWNSILNNEESAIRKERLIKKYELIKNKNI